MDVDLDRAGGYWKHALTWQVADIADVVRQRADGMVLSAETAIGQYPEKTVATLRQVITEVEEWCRLEMYDSLPLPNLATNSEGAIREQVG